MTPHYVCPRCIGPLTSETDTLHCAACELSYPVVDDVPYLAFYGQDWYEKLREVYLYRDFCHKVKSGAIERDRTSDHQAMGAAILRNLNLYFDQACDRMNLSDRPRILDVGAGCGEVSQKLAEMGAEVHAVDMNLFDLHYDVRWMTFGLPEDLGFFERIRGKSIDKPLFHRAIADADYLPYPDNHFDVVVLRAVAHHLFNLSRFMAEANRVLCAGGQLILIAEPLASIIDDPREYSTGDLDYEEGMHETRPLYYKYRKAIKSGGFTHMQVQAYFAGFGYRLSRLQNKWKLRFDADKWLSRKLISPPRAVILHLVAGCMNLYARKSVHRPRTQVPRPDRTIPHIPMAKLLAEMQHSPELTATIVRDHLPEVHRQEGLDLASLNLDRMAARAVRPPESIHGRTARYLLSTATFYLDTSLHPNPVISVHYNASDAADHTPSPRFILNGSPIDVVWNYSGWNNLAVSIPSSSGAVVELRIEQPGLSSALNPPPRDIGLAISMIEILEGTR